LRAEKDALRATEAAKVFDLNLKKRRRQAPKGVIPAKKVGRRGVFSQAE
jgi:hypothetical protein